MEFSKKLPTVKAEWSIVYLEGLQIVVSKKYCIFFSEYLFWVANSADPDEMLLLGLHCLPKYPFRSFQATKALTSPID